MAAGELCQAGGSDCSLEVHKAIQSYAACARMCRPVPARGARHPAPLTIKHLDILTSTQWHRSLTGCLACWLVGWLACWLAESKTGTVNLTRSTLRGVGG